MKAVWQAVSTVFVACLLAILSSAVLAQDGGNNLIAAEAFFDDPALAPGSGTPLPFSGASDAAFNEALGSVDLTGLDAGSHTVYVRFQDAYGDWSAPLGQSFYIPEGSLGDGNSVGGANRIQTAEAFFDADPGPGAGFPIAVPVDGAIDASFEVLRGAVDLSGVTPGQHTLYVRFKDAAGVWSAPLGQSVYITPELIGSAGGENRIVAAEYQIDGGAFQPAPVEDGVLGGLVEVVGLVETVSSDFHTARVRFQNSAGHWSQHTSSPPPPPPSPDDLDSDGLPDAWEQEWFGGLGQSGSDDPDGDGLTNLEENQQGSDPLTPDNLASPTISGFVLDTGGERLSGITVCIAGVVAHCDAGTDAFGHYVLGAATALADGDYTVTPQSASWVFTPSSQDVTISGASASGIDFTAEPPPPVPPPVAAIDSVAPETPTVGELVEFIGSAGPDGQVIDLYHWSAAELVNGLPLADRLEIGSTPSFVTDILRAGEWRIYLQVRNTDKLWSEAATLDITVLDDLGLSDLAVNPSSIRFLDQNGNQVFNPDQGDEVTVRVEVQNLGEVDTPDEVTLSLYDGSAEDGVLIGETAVPAIPAGGAVTLEAPWVVGFDIDGVPIPDYQDDYKIITIEAEFTGNLTQVQGMTSVAKTAELVAMARAGTGTPEVTRQNNRATSAVLVGQLPAGSYGIDLTVNATQTPYAGGTVTLFGQANYQWGLQLPVMGAQVVVKLDTGNGGEIVARTLTTAPGGIYVAKIQLPDAPGSYQATVTVFDGNLYASATTTLDIAIVPTEEEWNQENGGSSGGGGSSPPPAPAPTRDLTIHSIKLTGDGLYRLESGADAVVLNSSLEVTARIVNAGNLPVDDAFDVIFYAGDPDAGGTPLATETVSSLLDGELVDVTSSVLWPLDERGKQSIYVQVDVTDAVNERDEYNNERRRIVDVREYLPDLRPYYVRSTRVSGLYFSATPVVGEPVTLYVDVYNNGPADLSNATFEVVFYLGDPTNGQEIGRTTVPQMSLAEGAKLTAFIQWTPTTAANGTIYAVVDPDDTVSEDVETNNRTSKSFGVTPKEPSLWPVELQFSNHAPRPNTVITINAIVQNKGVEDAENEIVEFYLGDPDAGGNLIGTAAIDILYGQSSRSDISIDWTTPGTDGTYRIYALVQGNKYSRKLTVSNNPPPDLVVESGSIVIDPPNPAMGDEVEVMVAVRNESAETAATDFTVSVYVDTPAGFRQLGTSETIAMLDPNAAWIVRVTEKIQIDQPYYAILAKVLPNPAQGDADYRNNEATTSFGVGSEAVGVQFIDVDPEKSVYGPGDTVIFEWLTNGLPESEDMVLSMKRASAADWPLPQNENWYRFTTTASNQIDPNNAPSRISEEFNIPAGLAVADDWTFCVGHEDSDIFDCSNETFTYQDTLINEAPIANAGEDQTVEAGTQVTLNGSGSSDPDGTIASYAWAQLSGTPVTISGADTSQPTFTAPSAADVLSFELTVTDNGGLTATDTVTVTVELLPTLTLQVTDAGRVEALKLVNGGLLPWWETDESGISCVGKATCDETYSSNYQVHLRPVPNDGYRFKAWSGCSNEGDDYFLEDVSQDFIEFRKCAVTMTGDKTVRAEFEPVGSSGEAGTEINEKTNPEEFVEESLVSDPINTSTGAHIITRTLLRVNGAQALVFRLRYDSLLRKIGPVGRAWGHDFEAYLIELPNGDVDIRWNANRVNRFEIDASGGLSSPDLSTQFDTLVKNGDGSYTLTREDRTVYEFDAFGQLLEMRNRIGQSLLFGYDGSDRLQTVIDPISGKALTFAYNADDLLESVTDPLGRQVLLNYDADANLTEITDAAGNTTIYTYDSDGRVLTGTDAEGVQIFSNTYDDQGRVIAQDDAVGGNQVTTLSYDETTQPGEVITTVTNRHGDTRTWVHNSNYRLLSIKDELGNAMATYTYDDQGQRTSATDANGNTSTFGYDGTGNLTTVTDPAGNVTTFTYDDRRNLLSVQNALGHRFEFTYDANNNLIGVRNSLGETTEYTYDSNGLRLTMTRPRGGVTRYSYQNGLLETVTDPEGTTVTFGYDAAGRPISTADAENHTIKMGYDGIDNLTLVQDPLGNTIEFTYNSHSDRLSATDANGNVTRYTYDGNGNLISRVDALGHETRYGYDNEDRLAQVTDALGHTTELRYDPLGRLIAVVDPLGNVRSMKYDPASNPTELIDALGNTILKLAYDALDNPVTAEDALGRTRDNEFDSLSRLDRFADPLNRVTDYGYDALNRLVASVDALGGTAAQEFDKDANLTALIDPNVNKTQFGYNLAGRLTSETAAWGAADGYAYDSRGLVSQYTNRRGQSRQFQYDAAGRLTSFSDPNGTVSFTYDGNGNVLTVSDANGASERQYDALNRVVRYTDARGNVIRYTYDAVGKLTTLTYPDGKAVQYGYDAANRLTTVTDWAGRETSYNYDANGRLVRTERANGTVMTRTYDAAGQLTQQRDQDAQGNVISQYDFAYDAAGNVTSEQSSRAPQPFYLSEATMTYTSGNRLATYNGESVVYDADGNMTDGPLGENVMASYEFDSRNRLAGVHGTEYRYDAEGYRFSVVENGVETQFVVNPHAPLSQVLVQTVSGNTPTYYVYGMGLIGEEQDGRYFTYHYDRRGSTIALTNGSGTVVEEFWYSPYGSLVDATWPIEVDTPFLYNGRDGIMTDGNRLYYMRARYFNPAVRRFTTQDPILGTVVDIKSLNLYAYVKGNPIVNIDPSGLTTEDGLTYEELKKIGEDLSEIGFDIFLETQDGTLSKLISQTKSGFDKLYPYAKLYVFGVATQMEINRKILEDLESQIAHFLDATLPAPIDSINEAAEYIVDRHYTALNTNQNQFNQNQFMLEQMIYHRLKGNVKQEYLDYWAKDMLQRKLEGVSKNLFFNIWHGLLGSTDKLIKYQYYRPSEKSKTKRK